jgi:hypothetical protein
VVEVVQALLVACSRTYTLDRTFDLGSQGVAHGDDGGESAATGYKESSTLGPFEGRGRRKLEIRLTSRRASVQFRV